MALEGTLNYLDVAHLLKVVGTTSKSGILEIRWEDREARLYFQSGRLIRAESNRFHEGIGQLLVRSRLLSESDLERALELQQGEDKRRRLGAILCDEFSIDPEVMERLLCKQFEQIVYDVFSWPGGVFQFQFTEPKAMLDRFNLNPVAFISEVGIQAGLLADEGVGREQGHDG